MKTVDNFIFKTAKSIKTIGHPIRLEILRLLNTAKNRRLTVKEIQGQLGLSQPDASKHLAVLKKSNVLLCERVSGSSYYFVNANYSFVSNIIDFVNRND